MEGFTIKCNKCGQEWAIVKQEDANHGDSPIAVLQEAYTDHGISIYCECGNEI